MTVFLLVHMLKMYQMNWHTLLYHTQAFGKIARWDIVSILGLRTLHAINTTSQKNVRTHHTITLHVHTSILPLPPSLGTNLNTHIQPTY